MVALITFYRLARPVLRSYNILRKFLVIKVIIFLTVMYAPLDRLCSLRGTSG